MRRGYLETGISQECFGCEACKQVCPEQCIELKMSFNGFLYPEIDMGKCINCDLCRKVCPYSTAKKMLDICVNQEVYAARSKDETVREQSTSGGLFTELSVPILKNRGIIFGVILSEEFAVFHKSAESIEKLLPMRGSKYVQSQIKETYQEAKAYLEKEIKVLFSGTPCQVAGLRKFLGKDYADLITVDLICHGVLAPRIATYHIKGLESQYRSNAVHVRFRDKSKGWKQSMAFGVDFENGKTYYENGKKDKFFNMFLSNYDLRECCYACPFADSRRIGDITLGDFWGIENKKPHLFDDKGHSVVLLNTEKGKVAFDKIKDSLYVEKSSLVEAMQEKLKHPTTPDIWRKYYLKSVKNNGLERTIDSYALPRPLWMKGLRYVQRAFLRYLR